MFLTRLAHSFVDEVCVHEVETCANFQQTLGWSQGVMIVTHRDVEGVSGL